MRGVSDIEGENNKMTIEQFAALFGVLAVIVAAAWALLAISARQFDKRLEERFAMQDKAREEGRKESDDRYRAFEESQRALEHNFLSFKAQLPIEYVRREDHIRFETVINAKMDSVYTKLELIAERQLNQRTPS